MTPSDVSADSVFLAWWKCENGHSYRMRVCDRIAAADAGVKNNCPVCDINSWTNWAEPGTSPQIGEEEE
tara:strand:+ start:770 stop:976 length:207 start_codon:yes stop_codon:yes gene_type:complete